MIERGECDFVTDIAAELPLQVIVEMMGVPNEDRHKVFEWSNLLIGFDDPEYAATPETGRMAATEMFMYANTLAVERLGCPRDDLITMLMNAEVDGEKLSELEFDSFFLLLAVAGNETTRNLISGGMLALFEHPAQFAALTQDPSLLYPAVEEMLRWVTPVMYFRRTVQRDTEIRGRPIAEGDKVCIYYGVGEPRRGVLPGRRRLRHHPQPEPARRLRARRRALLPGREPGAAGDQSDVRGDPQAPAGHRAGGRAAAAALELHQRDQAHAGAVHAGQTDGK